MNTPISDFVQAYTGGQPVRLHMPGHKGRVFLGPEPLDITEIDEADELYHAKSIIRESQENAAALFGAAKTLYSAEGSSLCIRAMLYLAQLHARAQGRPFRLLAGRNAHKALMSAAALLDADIEWLYPAGDCPYSGRVTKEAVDAALSVLPDKPAAVYITSPDYLGCVSDVAGIAAVCRKRGALLLVDNAHGAYLRFLPENRHPLALGADLCCDSAHKTLPVLTGGAYLHLSHRAPDLFRVQAERAMALFASTSPSWLILQSLDRANAYLAGDYRERLAALAERMDRMKERLREHGYTLVGDEPLKLTIAPGHFGYGGSELYWALRRDDHIVCEFSDGQHLTAMATPETAEAELKRLETALLRFPRREKACDPPPPLPRPHRAMSVRQAMLSPQNWLPVEKCLGRVLADAHVGCPPAVPIVAAGERIDEDALRCFRFYGISECAVVAE